MDHITLLAITTAISIPMLVGLAVWAWKYIDCLEREVDESIEELEGSIDKLHAKLLFVDRNAVQSYLN